LAWNVVGATVAATSMWKQRLGDQAVAALGRFIARIPTATAPDGTI
jgi:hypothetical protein